MFRYAISIAFLCYMAVSSALFYILALVILGVTYFFDPRRVVLHLFTCFWASQYMWIMPAWSVRIKGREKLKTGEPLVMVSNHQSLLDTLVVYGLFVPFKWVSKIEVFKLPFIGWNMTLNRYIGLRRGDKDSAQKMLLDCELALKQGSSVYLFPEGTRSRTGQIKAFKLGAFILAHAQQVDIQPLVINGTQNALPKNSLKFHGHHQISLEVLEPIPYQDFASLSVEETRDKVQRLIQERLEKIQKKEAEHKVPLD